MAIEVEGQLPKNADAKTLKETHSIFFGANKGKTVQQMLEENASWILWAQKNVAFIRFTDEVLEKAQGLINNPHINFSFSEDQLRDDVEVLQNMSKGLDSYGENGVRQLHGFSNNVDLHKVLNRVALMSKYILQEKAAGRSIDLSTKTDEKASASRVDIRKDHTADLSF